MESVLIKYKVRENKKSRVENWVEYFNKNKMEIKDTLIQEGILIESVFQESVGDEIYIYYYVKAKNLQTAIEIFKSSENPHDLYHKKFMNESLEYVANLANLVDIDTIN